nr:MAG TPA_asm: hypothetical protein [Caudoviricetes sp.]
MSKLHIWLYQMNPCFFLKGFLYRLHQGNLCVSNF